jgi:hypothetical protein
MTHNPFKTALVNSFVNGRGEYSTNLQSSKSKIAERLRAERREEGRQEVLRQLRWKRSELLAKLKRLGRKPSIVEQLATVQASIAAIERG